MRGVFTGESAWNWDRGLEPGNQTVKWACREEVNGTFVGFCREEVRSRVKAGESVFAQGCGGRCVGSKMVFRNSMTAARATSSPKPPFTGEAHAR